MDFKLQTASKTPFSEPSLAILHLLKFSSSSENKLLRKKVESSAKALSKKAWLRIVISLMSALFLINSKRTSIASINKYAGKGDPGVLLSLS